MMVARSPETGPAGLLSPARRSYASELEPSWQAGKSEPSTEPSVSRQAAGMQRGAVMKSALAGFIGLLLIQGAAAAQSRNVDVGMSIADGRVRSFYLAIGDYYGVPPPQVVDLRERYRYPDEDFPVVYFLAARAHVAPAAIISLRMQRVSWLDITFRLRL